MFFRPEEIHGTSGKREIAEPIPKTGRRIRHQAFRLSALYLTIFHLHTDRRPAIKAGRIDPNNVARKKPADRQRLESSLGEPLLLAFNGDAVLSGKVVKRRKRTDIVGIGIQPSGKSRGEKRVQNAASFFRVDSQLGCKLCIVRRLPCRQHAIHDDLIGLVQLAGCIHNTTSFNLGVKEDTHNYMFTRSSLGGENTSIISAGASRFLPLWGTSDGIT